MPFSSMNREQIQSFIKECRSYMLEQLQKEVVYYLKDNDVLTDAEFEDIIKLVNMDNKSSFHQNCRYICYNNILFI